MPNDPWGDTGGGAVGYNPYNGGGAGAGSSGGGFWDSFKNWWNNGYSNTPNTTGGGGGGGFGPAMGTKATSTASAILPWLQFAMQVYEGQKGGNFIMPPLTPEQKQMLDYAMGVLKGTPRTADYAFPILGYDLSHPATLDFEALRRGETGFHPAQHMSPDDLARVLANARNPPSTTEVTGDGSVTPKNESYNPDGTLKNHQANPFASNMGLQKNEPYLFARRPLF